MMHDGAGRPEDDVLIDRKVRFWTGAGIALLVAFVALSLGWSWIALGASVTGLVLLGLPMFQRKAERRPDGSKLT
jgi:hypothetical protein